MKNSSENIELSESAEQKLKYITRTKNIRLPESINEDVTCQAVLLENDALVYVYKVDDTYFFEIKDNLLSKDMQLNEIRLAYSEMKPMIDLLVETYRGICYRYICRESGEVAECKIDYNKLVNL